jgi:hypothetical protein
MFYNEYVPSAGIDVRQFLDSVISGDSPVNNLEITFQGLEPVASYSTVSVANITAKC